MQKVAAYISEVGRVSIAELAHKSNSFIELKGAGGGDKRAAVHAELNLDDDE